MSDSRWVPPGPYRQKLLAERFVPWPLHKPEPTPRSTEIGIRAVRAPWLKPKPEDKANA